jgi:hypothetical protein
MWVEAGDVDTRSASRSQQAGATPSGDVDELYGQETPLDEVDN